MESGADGGGIRDAMPDVTFGAVSLQLKVLLDAGLVECEADRQFRVYRIKGKRSAPSGQCSSRCGTTRSGVSSCAPSLQRLVADQGRHRAGVRDAARN